MNITACLAWYDEPPDLLHRCVSSLAGVCDRVVAVDGRWELFPGDDFLSSRAERDAIFGAAHEAQIAPIVIRPARSWVSQVEKRRWLISFARERTDWLLVIDADEHVTSGDRAQLDASLETTLEDVAEVPLTNLAAEWPLNELPVHTFAARRLFRAAAEPRYARAHNGVLSAAGAWLNGDPRHVELAPAATAAGIALGHAVDARAKDRQTRRTDYYRARNASKIEDWRQAA